MTSSPAPEKSPGTLETLSSIQFGLVALTAITAVAVIGTIIPQGRPLEFYHEQYGTVMFTLIQIFRLDTTYTSPLFIGLLGLFGLNLILCSAKRFPSLIKTTFRPDTAPGRAGISGMPIRFTLEKTYSRKSGVHFYMPGFP